MFREEENGKIEHKKRMVKIKGKIEIEEKRVEFEGGIIFHGDIFSCKKILYKKEGKRGFC